VAIGPPIPAPQLEPREINDAAQAWIEGKIRSWQEA
jgi:hypothetical protein